MELFQENKQKAVVNIYEDRRCYKKADLSKEEIEYRLCHGYHESEQWDIESNKCKAYLLKPRFNESDSHLFLIYRITDYLRKFTNKIWLFETEKPDIIFIHNGKKVAIEIETGMMYEKASKRLLKKIKQLNREFGKNWFFVVTNKEYYWKYSKLGKTTTRKGIIEMLNLFKEG